MVVQKNRKTCEIWYDFPGQWHESQTEVRSGNLRCHMFAVRPCASTLYHFCPQMFKISIWPFYICPNIKQLNLSTAPRWFVYPSMCLNIATTVKLQESTQVFHHFAHSFCLFYRILSAAFIVGRNVANNLNDLFSF